VRIVDDADEGFAAAGAWRADTSSGLGGGRHVGGTGAGSAEWTFPNVMPGYRYRVAATWTPTHERAAPATFTISDRLDESTVRVAVAVTVDQSRAPEDLAEDGGSWETLGPPVLVRGTTLSVRLTGEVAAPVADAVRIERVGDWQAPVGIPTPDFGISQSHMAYARPGCTYDYGSGPEAYRIGRDGPYTHYVDVGSGEATDKDNPFGTPERPRKSLPRDLPAGSVVEVHGGPYLGGWHISARASAERPVFVRGASPERRPEVRANIAMTGCYVVLENVLQTGQKDITVSPSADETAHHVAVRRCELIGQRKLQTGSALIAFGQEGLDVHHVVFYGNRIFGQGDSEDPSETDRHGIAVTRHTNNVWVVDNHVSFSQADALQINGWANESTHHVYVGRNCFHDDGENAVDIKEASDVIVSRNLMYGYRHVSGAAFNAHRDDGGVFGPRNVWVLFNEIHDAYDGIVSMGIKGDFHVIGNVIHHVEDAGVKGWSDGRRQVWSNTIFSARRGIAYSGTEAIDIADNVIAEMTGGGDHVYVSDPEAAAASTMSNNLLHQPGGTPSIRWGRRVYHDLDAFEERTGKGAGCLDAPPRFVDPAKGNFRLQGDSPAIDAGLSMRHLTDLFEHIHGLSIATDADGRARPQGRAVDLGAYEAPSANAVPAQLITVAP
jgi:hypothetical protein